MRYVYSPRIERLRARAEAAADFVFAVVLGLLGATFLVLWLSW